MKHLLKFSLLSILLGLFSCSGDKKESAEKEADKTDAAKVEIDYSKPAYLRGKVKQMEIKGCLQCGDMLVMVNPEGKMTEIAFGGDKKVLLEYDADNNLVKYVSNAEARNLPMFGAEFVDVWFRNLLVSYYDSDISFIYENGKIASFTDAKKGWTETFSYDDNGNISAAKISDTKGTQFNNPRYLYEEKDGKVYKTINSGYESVSYTYDTAGRLVASDESITNITYNDKNDIVECKSLVWDDEFGGVIPDMVTKYTYTYDDNGNWTKREGTAQKWNNETKSAIGEEQALPAITRTITYYE